MNHLHHTGTYFLDQCDRCRCYPGMSMISSRDCNGFQYHQSCAILCSHVVAEASRRCHCRIRTKNAAESDELKFQPLPPRRTFSKSGASSWKVQIIKGEFAVLVEDWPLVVALAQSAFSITRFTVLHNSDNGLAHAKVLVF